MPICKYLFKLQMCPFVEHIIYYITLTKLVLISLYLLDFTRLRSSKIHELEAHLHGSYTNRFYVCFRLRIFRLKHFFVHSSERDYLLLFNVQSKSHYEWYHLASHLQLKFTYFYIYWSFRES